MFYDNIDQFHEEFLNQDRLKDGPVVYFAFSGEGDFLNNRFEHIAGRLDFLDNIHNLSAFFKMGSNFLDSKAFPYEEWLLSHFEELKRDERPILFFETPIVEKGIRYFVSLTFYHSSEKKCFIGIARRLKTIELETEGYYQQTIHDYTTGLLNKGECLKAVNAIKPSETKTYLVFLDLVRFKLINDVYGHMVGDDVLSLFAKALIDSKPANSHVYRFGGDEFVAIIKNSSKKEVLSFFDKLGTSLAKKNKYGVELGFSAGATKNDPEFISPLILIRCSDHGMYKAKRSNVPYYFMTRIDCEAFLPDE